jgi:hypothetical protein
MSELIFCGKATPGPYVTIDAGDGEYVIKQEGSTAALAHVHNGAAEQVPLHLESMWTATLMATAPRMYREFCKLVDVMNDSGMIQYINDVPEALANAERFLDELAVQIGDVGGRKWTTNHWTSSRLCWRDCRRGCTEVDRQATRAWRQPRNGYGLSLVAMA